MTASQGLNLTLKVWRQKNSQDKGKMETYQVLCVTKVLSNTFYTLKIKIFYEAK